MRVYPFDVFAGGDPSSQAIAISLEAISTGYSFRRLLGILSRIETDIID